jgi:predicted PurR-regulated permease PerM
MLTGLFPGDNREDPWRRTVRALVHTLLADEDGIVPGERIEILRRLIENKRGPEEAAKRIRELKEAAYITPQEAADALSGMDALEKQKLLKFLVLLTQGAQVFEGRNYAFLSDFSKALGITGDMFKEIVRNAEEERIAQDRLIRSGAGLLAAIGVILLFILTATLLRSVIFGLIGAYLLLPLEKYFEKKIRSGRGLTCRFVKGCEIFILPLNALSRAVRRKDAVHENRRTAQKSEDEKIVKQAVSLTVFVAGFFAMVCLIFLLSVTGRYVGELKNSVKNIRTSVAVKSQAGGTASYTARAEDYADEMMERLKEFPLVNRGIDFVRKSLSDEKTRKEIAGMVLRSTGGVVNFTAGVLGAVVAIVSDVILSLFFGLLFLFKLAEFCRTDSSSGRQSEYLVRTVFNGKWLPVANENTISEARNILSGTFMRLRIWVRGYLLLMLIDATVYSTAFFLLKVPYFPLLGVIAGCGILLPYICPIAGCLLTAGVTLAIGDGGGVQLFGLLLFYLIYSGIIEQFILYPAVIGESLGLTALETIIVVLLGAVFAGIAGMIFALPAASVIKFIVPKIYRCWGSSAAS